MYRYFLFSLYACFFFKSIPDCISQTKARHSVAGQARYEQYVAFSGSTQQTIIQASLLFNESVSLYKAEKVNIRTDSAVANVIRQISIGGDPEVVVFKDNTRQLLISREYIITSPVTVQDSLPTLPWVLGNKSRQIGVFICQDATAQFRGRVYTAWFTLQIPAPQGPWKLGGLPGLIIEAADADREIQFRLLSVELLDANSISIQRPSLTGSVSYLQYRNMLDKKLQSLQQMTQGMANSASSSFEATVKLTPSVIERSPK